jgi:hypothetical protein
MPRRAKVVAIGMMLTACSLSSLALGSPPLAGVVMGAGLVGTWYVGWRIPTRERMVAAGPEVDAEAAAATSDEAQPAA